MPSLRQETSRAFQQIIMAMAAILGAMLFLFFEIYKKFSLYLGALSHKITAACGCVEITQFMSMHPAIFGLLIVFAVGLSSFAGYAAYRAINLFVKTKKFIRLCLSCRRPRLEAKLRFVIKKLNLSPKNFVEINGGEPLVFCFGFLKPKICVSRPLVKLLTGKELQAVIRHEYQHLISREPLKFFLVKCFHNFFFFLPIIKILVKKYLTFAELAADHSATIDRNGKSELAGAILKISQPLGEQTATTGLALSFFGPVIRERVNHLYDDAYVPKFGLLGRGLLAFFLSASLIASFVLLFLFDSDQAFAMHRIDSCGEDGASLCQVMKNQNMSYANHKSCGNNNACQSY